MTSTGCLLDIKWKSNMKSNDDFVFSEKGWYIFCHRCRGGHIGKFFSCLEATKSHTLHNVFFAAWNDVITEQHGCNELTNATFFQAPNYDWRLNSNILPWYRSDSRQSTDFYHTAFHNPTFRASGWPQLYCRNVFVSDISISVKLRFKKLKIIMYIHIWELFYL